MKTTSKKLKTAQKFIYFEMEDDLKKNMEDDLKYNLKKQPNWL